MANDVRETVNALLAFVQQNSHRGLSRAGDEFRCLQNLDAEAFAACSEAGIQLPELSVETNLRPFGLTHIPSYRSSAGFSVVATDDWLQSMRGILAIAARSPVKPDSRATTDGAAESDAKKKQRGRPNANYETVQREAELAADWQLTKESKGYKSDFANDNDMTVKEFNKLLDRVSARERRSDN